ncbi:MAG: hypothetical protein WED07_03355 [Candidatus Freyarchaeum deiterrae]
MSKKQPVTPQAWTYNAKYLGGHAAFAKDAVGILYLYPGPDFKVVFESKTVNIQIPLSSVTDSKIVTEKELSAARVFLVGILAFAWKKKNRMLLVEFKDNLGSTQTPVFEPQKVDEVASKLYEMRQQLKMKS